MGKYFLESERVGLRRFLEADRDLFAQMNADPDVMEFFPAKLSRLESDAMFERINNGIQDHGYGLWAAIEKSTDSFMGFVGLQDIRFEAEFAPAVEIGWRLAKSYWGRGLATESAMRCLEFAFCEAKLTEVVSMTAMLNEKSFRVMERIGMSRSEEFEHPMVPDGHRLKRHFLYRISQQQFHKMNQ